MQGDAAAMHIDVGSCKSFIIAGAWAVRLP
jgi:hypothetical protein